MQLPVLSVFSLVNSLTRLSEGHRYNNSCYFESCCQIFCSSVRMFVHEQSSAQVCVCGWEAGQHFLCQHSLWLWIMRKSLLEFRPCKLVCIGGSVPRTIPLHRNTQHRRNLFCASQKSQTVKTLNGFRDADWTSGLLTLAKAEIVLSPAA